MACTVASSTDGSAREPGGGRFRSRKASTYASTRWSKSTLWRFSAPHALRKTSRPKSKKATAIKRAAKKGV